MLKTCLRLAREATPLSLFAAAVGVCGFIVSFALAWTMLRAQGNPAFLLIWLMAVAAMTTFTRFHLKWAGMFERIHAMNVPDQFRHGQNRWSRDAEDVVFRDMPN